MAIQGIPLLILLLCFPATHIFARKIDLPPDWLDQSLQNGGNETIPVSSAAINYKVLNFGGDYIGSDNQNFSLATHDDNSIYLLMRIGKIAVPVRTFDSTSPVENATSVEVENSGNLLLQMENGSVWQSFEHPTDILLPGQSLHQGMSIQSSETFPDFYYFSMVIEDNRILWTYAFYSPHVQQLQYQAYQAWSFEASCKGAQTTLRYTGRELQIANGCEQRNVPTTSNTSEEPILPFIRFQDDGHLHSYKFAGDEWVEDVSLANLSNVIKGWEGDPYCKYPLDCRGFGVCTDGNCSCLKTDDFGSCSRTYDDVCYDGESQARHAILDTHYDGIGYTATKFMEPSQRNSTLDKCKNACLRMECNCTTLFFHKDTKNCYFLTEIQGSLHKDDSSVLYIKTLHLKTPVIYTVSATILGTVVLFCFLAQCALYLLNRRLKSNPAKEIESILAGMQGRLPQRFSYVALDTATKGYSTMLGSGGYGSMYKGVLSDGRHVAVKKLQHRGTQGAKQFMTEIAGMGSISHVNIVKLCGFCIEGVSQWLLVYEFMPNGSLDKWLFHDSDMDQDPLCLSWERRVSIALGMAQGLAYLHEECSEPILHLDIKPQNILLDTNFVAKVADFGMAKLLENSYETQVMTTMRGTPGYMAPEWLTHFMATKRCDVYSYGKVLLELIGGRRNIDLSKVASSDSTAPDESWYFPARVVKQVEKGKLLDVIDEKVRATASENYNQVKLMVHLALWCIQDNAAARPSMRTIVEVLQGHLDLGSLPDTTKVWVP